MPNTMFNFETEEAFSSLEDVMDTGLAGAYFAYELREEIPSLVQRFDMIYLGEEYVTDPDQLKNIQIVFSNEWVIDESYLANHPFFRKSMDGDDILEDDSRLPFAFKLGKYRQGNTWKNGAEKHQIVLYLNAMARSSFPFGMDMRDAIHLVFVRELFLAYHALNYNLYQETHFGKTKKVPTSTISERIALEALAGYVESIYATEIGLCVWNTVVFQEASLMEPKKHARSGLLIFSGKYFNEKKLATCLFKGSMKDLGKVGTCIEILYRTHKFSDKFPEVTKNISGRVSEGILI